MAVVTKSSNVSPDGSTASFGEHLSGYLAGEAIAAGDACYLKAADGRIWRSNGTANDAAAKCDGFAAAGAAAGEAVTLYGRGVILGQYAAGMTVSGLLYVAATAGQLDTAPTTGGLVAVAKAISATDIRIVNLVP